MEEREGAKTPTYTKEQAEMLAFEVVRLRGELAGLLGERATEIGRNEKWQQMFEELLESASLMALFIKETYMTKRIEVARLQQLYMVADATEKMAVSYRRRKEKVDSGEKRWEEVNDDEP